MRINNLKTLSIIFIVLVGFLAYKIWLPQIKPQTSAFGEKVKGTTAATVQNIQITKDKDTVILTKEQNEWKVNGKKANKTKIEDMLSQLLPQSAELISQNESRQKEFEVANELGTKVKLGNSITMLLGKSVSGGSYVRFDNDKDVFLLKNLYAYSISTDNKEWMDKTILLVDKDKIQKLSFQINTSRLSLIKEKDKWTIEGENKEPKKDKLDSLLLNLSSLNADSVADKDTVQKYPEISNSQVTIEYDGKKETLQFYKGESDYLVKRQSDGENFLVSNSKTEEFQKAPENLR